MKKKCLIISIVFLIIISIQNFCYADMWIGDDKSYNPNLVVKEEKIKSDEDIDIKYIIFIGGAVVVIVGISVAILMKIKHDKEENESQK